jgi:hypothetical protein
LADAGLQHNEVIMDIKANLFKATFAIGLTAVIATAFAFQSEQPKEQPQVVITSDSYVMVDKFCEEYCAAKVQADEYEIFVEYKLDDASVEFLDILNVVRHDETVNAYVDQHEIQKINAAIAGGAE